MDARKIALVQETFDKIAAAGARLSETFYAELFAIDPGLRTMFDHDMRRQHMKFLMTLTLIVRSLREPEKLQQAVRHLAIKHVQYGVQPGHFTPFGNALLRTLKKTLGPGYSRDVAAAWEEAFRLLARTMKQAEFHAGMAERQTQHAGQPAE